MPMSRGMQSTIYVKLAGGNSADDLRSHLQVTLTLSGNLNPFAPAAILAEGQRGHFVRHSVKYPNLTISHEYLQLFKSPADGLQLAKWIGRYYWLQLSHPESLLRDDGDMGFSLCQCQAACRADSFIMLQAFYKEEPFVHVLAKGQIPHTRHVRGSNFNLVAVFDDRLSGRAIIISGNPCLALL